MMHRLYQDLANAHIAELEQESQSARLARPRGARVGFKVSKVTRFVARPVTPLRRLLGWKRLGLRRSADRSSVSPRCECDQVAGDLNPVLEIQGGAHRIGRSHELRSTRYDAPPCSQERPLSDTGIMNIPPETGVKDDESASTKSRTEEVHRAVQRVAQY